MTKEEKHLWYDFLRTYPVRFSRQKILGTYIADFYCAEAKLVIELDGSGHYTEEGTHRDEERTAFQNNPSVSLADSSLCTREPFLFIGNFSI